ncbi:hypothetical protein [Helicobacter apodemus]|uniref:Uncharacterized protein n=1 Tax=Helicobacter apodemus TaxID=135569 RepID=A0A2U8FEX1_9HELI|nr:hypothetical protein [Helicobacter apodemus]AWI34792.1 hypothetical protein CDV25_08470 [Helicobacter apodemus]
MKKLFLTLLVSLGFISSLSAQELDFIAVATQGKFNENSLGVKALSDEEMSKVVGRLYQIGGHVITPTLVSKYYIVEKSDLNYDSRLIQEATSKLHYGEALAYVKRYYQSQVEWTWLAGYNLYTKEFREIPFSASMQSFQFIDSQYKYSHY